jgi:hypothetical protein
MAAVDDIIGKVPIAAIAKKLGVDEATARAAVEQAVPALTGGLQANSASPGGAESIAKALEKHSAAPDDVDVDRVDEADGDKIVTHIFGDRRSDVVQRLGGAPGPADSSIFAKLLPLLAPIVMAQLAKQLGGSGGGISGGGKGGGGGGLSDLLGSVLGGGGGKGGGVGDLLGDLLGGGRR